MKKVLFLTNYASPYRVDFFNEYGKYVDLTVLLTDHTEDQKHRSQEWFQGNRIDHFKMVNLEKKHMLFGKPLFTDVLNWLKKGFDTIILGGYTSPTQLYAIEYMRLHHIPFCIEIDGGLIKPAESKFRYQIKRHFISSASLWLSSGREANKYLAYYGAEETRCHTYPFSSIREEELLKAPVSKEEKISLREKLSVRESRMLLTVGQFIPRKGFDVLLEAITDLPPDIGVYFVGGEPTEEYLSYVREHNLTNVHFIGFKRREPLAEYYRAADLFVLPTREDIWGLVVNEALAYGLPVITTDRCGAGMTLINEDNGRIVPADNASALAQSIQELLALPADRMRSAALLSVQEYTISGMVKRHLEIL